MLASLNPVYVFRVISIIGRDYFVVIAMWFVATGVTIFAGRALPSAGVPVVGGIFSGFLSYYVLFYASHLLGYAVYRHAPELGWE